MQLFFEIVSLAKVQNKALKFMDGFEGFYLTDRLYQYFHFSSLSSVFQIDLALTKDSTAFYPIARIICADSTMVRPKSMLFFCK